MMATLSVVIPVKNTAAFIKPCLESIKWADEVILVDMGSTDGSLELFTQYPNCRVIHNIPADGNFTLNRKLGFDQAKGDWIMRLDSDEVLSPPLQEEIKAFLSGASEKEFNGVFVKADLYMFGKQFRYSMPLWELKMVRKGTYALDGLDVHGHLTVEGRTRRFRNVYIHDSAKTFFQWINKLNYYTEYDMNKSMEQKKISFFRVIFTPPAVFFINYFLLGGFRDGRYGFIMIILNSFYSFIEKLKIWHAQNEGRKSEE
jgi:glycosyltransferase involved in cell wall biosynthesis